MKSAEPQPTSLTLEAAATTSLPSVEVQTITVILDLEDQDIETLQLIIQPGQGNDQLTYKYSFPCFGVHLCSTNRIFVNL